MTHAHPCSGLAVNAVIISSSLVVRGSVRFPRLGASEPAPLRRQILPARFLLQPSIDGGDDFCPGQESGETLFLAY
ncbi:hypothetical protein NGR_c14990 [Sinorhizobium fredii NGR234]|uniref:Uncharacterized protein n=1 Tax=Sinorhizobium fredii (strain NBRC 101917 / NGR234) TaxID=394 RepID=C3MCJ1_SINFN|nr:hypothetical protein NGR_c14990 [Sinorhizobium fredii NGR234]